MVYSGQLEHFESQENKFENLMMCENKPDNIKYRMRSPSNHTRAPYIVIL